MAAAQPEKRGVQVLVDAFANKGLGFTAEQRDQLGLRGLLPPAEQTVDLLIRRELGRIRDDPTTLGKYERLMGVQDRDENLFLTMLLRHTEELTPIVYTPIVGEACRRYSHIFTRPRGMFFSIRDRGNIAAMLRSWPRDEVEAIVFTDGERILGLGDLGANGMGIPVGKLNLYVAFGGFHPAKVLPVTLDVGCNTPSIVDDPLYIGLRAPRVRGAEYEQFVGEFIEAAVDRFGRSLLLQFEDFGNTTAFTLLNHWRQRICCFNDDIQGTASVVLGGLIASARITGKGLHEHTYLFMGAGEAGVGIANLIAHAIAHEQGVTQEEAAKRIWLVDSRGLVVQSRLHELQHHKIPYAHEGPAVRSLIEAVKLLKPSAIIGVSATPGVFTEEVLAEMTALNDHPIVFALSNPTSQSECTAEQAYRGTGGRAVFASGSPFSPVEVEGVMKVPGQGNNAYVFPGIGLGAVVSGASTLSDHVFYIAAKALSTTVLDSDIDKGCLYPSLSRIREVSATIAAAVAEYCYDSGVALKSPRPSDLLQACKDRMYEPTHVYPSKM